MEQSLSSVLARADRAAALPRLGGMARPDGVVIVSERFWAFAGKDGSLREGAMPSPPEAVNRVPLARGLVRLGLSLSPLFRRAGVAGRREKPLLAAALIAPFLLFLLPGPLRMPIGLAATLGLAAWMLRGRTLRLHGAEHRAIAAAEVRSLVASWRGEARPSRFSPRCGTNFAALMIAVSLSLEHIWVLPTAALTPVLLPLVSLMVTMEIWLAAQRSAGRLARLLLWPGLLLQRLTTREPTLHETRIALRAVAAVLAADR